MDNSNLEYRVLKLEEEVRYLKSLVNDSNLEVSRVVNVEKHTCNQESEIKDNAQAGSTNIDIKQQEITHEMARLFFSFFSGRKDVYAKRSGKPHPKTGKHGYFTQCNNFWKPGICPRQARQSIKCSECPGQEYTPISQTVLLNHLQGNKADCSDVIGMYPLLEDNTCRFIVFDFDEHDLNCDLDNLKQTMIQIYKELSSLDIPFLLERSRSGRGFHTWMFFEEFIPAEKARQFANLLLLKLQDKISIGSFDCFDRIIPAQDELPINKITKKRGLGNLVALPLQGRAIKDKNTVFVNENLEPHYDQWEVLENTKRISRKFIYEKINHWSELVDSKLLGDMYSDAEFSLRSHNKLTINSGTVKPWNSSFFNDLRFTKSDADDCVELVLSNMLYISTKSMSARLQNYIRRLAAFGNPQFFKNKKLGFSNYATSRIIYCGHDEGGYICLPRGLLDSVRQTLEESNIEYRFVDKTSSGKPIKVKFEGNLYPEQADAIEAISNNTNGIIAATTAFGKTVVGAKIISDRKVNALVVVHTREIMENWIQDLSKFLRINEELPTYKTKTGLTRKRKSLIGKLYASHDSTTGIIDVVMYSSLGKGIEIKSMVKNYGLLIMDECHHGAAQTVEDVIGACTAKYVYGLTATPRRDDGLEKKIFFQFGPIRYRYTAKQRAAKMKIGHFVYPRFTSLICEGKKNINEIYKCVVNNDIRNKLIVDDVKKCIKANRNPIVITQFRGHADELFASLKHEADEVLLMYGASKKTTKDQMRTKLSNIPGNKSVILVATGKYIGEGFNFPRLDTLMLATPIAWRGNVEQYAGRLHRDYDTKEDTIIYDYVDNKVDVLQRMYYKRMKAYRSIGYLICDGFNTDIASTSIFYSHDNYFNDFERDIHNAKRSFYICSPWVNARKINWFKRQIEQFVDRPVTAVIETCSADVYPESMIARTRSLLVSLIDVGVQINEHKKLHQYFCIIDDEIVWYGKVNLLSREKDDDIIMRVVDSKIASQLKEFFYDKTNQSRLTITKH